MPVFTGTLDDFTTSSIFPAQIVITPSGPTVYNPGSVGYLFASKRIIVTPAADGTFSVNLFVNALARPDTYYTLTIEWLDGLGADSPEWTFRASPDGGKIIDLIETPWNPTLAWSGPDAPVGVPVASTLWLDTDSPMLTLSIWSN